MNAFQAPALLSQFNEAFEGHPFLSATPLTREYLGWAAVWIALMLALAAMSLVRRDL